ncbi:hypothetical protein CREGCYN_14080 [Synechococcus sp. M16CYN]
MWGGGDSACEEAVYLTKYGSHVHLIVRSERLRASAAMADRVLTNLAITVHWNSEVVDVSGKNWIDTLTLRNRGTESTTDLAVRGLFYAIGHTPNTELLQGQIDLDDKAYLVTPSGRPETSIDGVFSAGDVADAEWRQGITAAGSGCKAALAAERWLTHHNLATRVRRESIEPAVAERPINVDITTENTYSPDGVWQKGSYALRRLYHDSDKPLLVIYTSPSCGPCHVLKPQLQRLINEFNGAVQAVVIDIELDQDIAEQAGISGTPTTQLFHNKAMVKQWRGVKQRSEFKRAIEPLIS